MRTQALCNIIFENSTLVQSYVHWSKHNFEEQNKLPLFLYMLTSWFDVESLGEFCKNPKSIIKVFNFSICILLSALVYRFYSIHIGYQLILVMGKLWWFLNEQGLLATLDVHKYDLLPGNAIKGNSSKFDFLQKEQPKSNRLYHLDALRGIAAVSIILYHAAKDDHLILSTPYLKQINDAPITTIRGFIAKHGEVVVPFFVALSGYILSKVYWNDKRSKNLKFLFLTRITRFYPTHWLCMGLWLIVEGYRLFHYKRDDIPYFTYDRLWPCLSLTHVWAHDVQWGSMAVFCNPPSWSLSVEWLLNILMFFIIRMLPVYWGIFAFEMGALFGYDSHDNGLWGWSWSASLAFPFCVGILYDKLCSRFHFRKYIFLLMGDIFGIYLLLNPLQFMMRDMKYVPNFIHPSELFHAGLYGMYLIIALENSFILKYLFSKLSWLGDVSFAIYLSHNPLLVLHSNLIKLGYFDEIGNDFGMLLFMAWVILISYCIHHHFENPVKKHLDEQLGLTKRKQKSIVNKHVD